MEQGHTAVVHIVADVTVLRDGRVRDAGQPALGAPDRLRCPGRARREQQQQKGFRADAVGGHGLIAVRGQGLGVFRRVGAQDGQTGVQARQQRFPGGVGDQQPAIGVPDVGRHIGRTAGGVDAHDGRSGQRGTTQPEDEILDVVQQYPDVRWLVRKVFAAQVNCQGTPGGRFTDHLVPGPVPGPRAQTGMLIAQAIQQDLAGIGIKVNLKSLDMGTVIAAGGKKDGAPMIWSGGMAWIADFPDPSNFYTAILGCGGAVDGGWNWSWYCNKDLDKRAAEANAITDPAKANERAAH